MSDFHFLRPEWLLALPLFALLVWLHLRARGRGGVWQQVVDAALQPFVVEHAGGKHRRWRAGALMLAGVLAIVALAGPTWERVEVPVFRQQSALVIALDLSRSMNAADLEPSRLARARYKVADLLRLRRDGQTALVVFAAQAFVVTPLTDDTTTLLAQLQGLDTTIMPMQGSEPAAALELAAELLAQAGTGGGHVLLVSDGADRAALARARAAAAAAQLPVSVLAVGTQQGAPIPDAAGGFVERADGTLVVATLDSAALRDFAHATRGLYLPFGTGDGDLRRLERHLAAGLAERVERIEDRASSQWRDFGPWLLLPLLPLAALGFRRGALVVVALACLPLSTPPVRAGWWQTEDQMGQAAFEHEAWDEAAQRFEDPAWRGAAHYRAGDYAQAEAAFAAAEGASAQYNRGNALARLGRYEEAVAAYAAALEREPAHADAAHNKALIEALLDSERPPPAAQQGQSDAQQAGAGDEASADGAGQGRGPQERSAGRAADGAPGAAAEQDGGAETSPAASAEGEDARAQAAREAAREAADTSGSEDGRVTRDGVATHEESAAERAQATEQWLRQIPDDPGGLLRRKFQYQYKQRYGDQTYAGDRW